jgi:hypothetical protein
VKPFKLTVYFIIPTLYSIISSMTPMVTAPEDNSNFFILKPLLDEIVEHVVCPQMKLSKPVFQHVTANETVFITLKYSLATSHVNWLKGEKKTTFQGPSLSSSSGCSEMVLETFFRFLTK